MFKDSLVWSLQTIFSVVVVVMIASLIKNIVVFILSMIFGSASAVFIANCLTWPGVVLHETSHAVAGLLTGAKIYQFSVLPQGNTLGHVTFAMRGNFIMKGLQAACTGIAPAVVCPLVAYLLLGLKIDSGVLSLLRYYMIVCCILHCELSPQDIRGAITDIPGVLVILIFVYYVFISKKVQ